MADMLQMTYSEMENLVKALKTSSDDLENLSSQIMSLISDIQNAVGIKWLKTIVSHTDILNNTIYYLNDISSTTSETWQGDRYENFSGKILPSIINASEIITNKEDEFKEGLKAEIKPILEDLQKIAEDFKKQGAECGAQSIWIAQYLKEHQGVEAQSGSTNTSKSTEGKAKPIPICMVQDAKRIAENTGGNPSAASVDEFGDFLNNNDGRVRVGDTIIYGVNINKKDDGSREISFDASTGSDLNTVFKVYDKNGNLISTESLAGYHKPDNYLEAQVRMNQSVGDAFGTAFKGKQLYEYDSLNSKKHFTVNIPEGGFCEISNNSDVYGTELKDSIDSKVNEVYGQIKETNTRIEDGVEVASIAAGTVSKVSSGYVKVGAETAKYATKYINWVMKTSDKVLEAYSSKHSGEGRKGTLLLY